jgi:hypothetical protein
MIQAVPTHASQLILARVWILESPNPTTAAMATKIAVQMACEERALRAIDTLNMPDPETKIQTGNISK